MAIYEAYDDKIINKVGGGGSPTPSGYTINISASSSELYGQTIEVYSGGTKLTELTFSNSGSATLTVQSTGTYTFSVTITTMTYSSSVTVTEAINTYNTTIQYYPNGSTVTPTDDISIWLACGQRSETYTTLAEVLADSTCLSALMADSNAVDYLVRSKSFIGNEALVPTMTSDTTPSGQCFASSTNPTYPAWKAFDNNDATNWGANSQTSGAYIGYTFTEKKYVKKFKFLDASSRVSAYKIQGSNDAFSSDVHDLYSGSGSSGEATLTYPDEYSSYRFYYVTASTNALMHTLQFFGEDGICQNSTAMTYIGLNNYASNTLLADSDWRAGICNSAYFESVLNVKVPTMTSNTTPSGVASASSEYGDLRAWKAFDNDNSTRWDANVGSNTAWLEYEFASNVLIKACSVVPHNNGMGYKIQKYYNSAWVDISESRTTSGNAIFALNNNDKCAKYRMFVTSPVNGWANIDTLQFYGREDV